MEKTGDEIRESFLFYLITKGLSDRTLEEYLYYFEKWLPIELDDPKNLNEDMVNEFLSVNNNRVCRAFMKNYLRHRKKREIEIANVTGRKPAKKTVIIPEEHIQKLREYFFATNKRNWLLFELTYSGALRLNEIVNIRFMDLNMEQMSEDENVPARLLIRNGKGNKQRYVILDRNLIKELVKYAHERNMTMNDKIFPITDHRWQELFRWTCIKLGFVGFDENDRLYSLYHTHSLRHTRSSEWYENGVDIVAIQSRLGHSDISTTRLYITPDEKKFEKEWSEEYK